MPNILHVNSTSSPQSAQGTLMSSNQCGSSDPVHDLPPELLQAGWRIFWSRRQNRPYFFNQVTNESLWEMPILSPVTEENFYKELRISICSILGSVPEEAVDGIYHAIQNAGFESISDLHLVQEDDLMCILKPIPRRKLIKSWSKSCFIKESMCKCEKRKNENANRQINEFLAETKSSFDYSTHTVTMDDLLKTNISRILKSESEETVNNIIHALKYAGLQFLLDLHFVREDDLIQVLKPCQRRKLIKAWSQQGILFLYSSDSAVINEHHNTHEGSSPISSLLPNNATSSIPDLSMLAQRQATVGSNHMDTSQPLENQLQPYMDQICPSLPPELLPRVSSFTDHNSPLPPGLPPGVSHFTAHGPLLPGPPPRDPRFNDHSPLPPGPPPGVSRFTAHGPLLPGPSPRDPRLTDYGSLPPGPPPEVPGVTDQFCGPLQSGPSSRVSNLSSVDDESIPPVFNLCSDYKWKRTKSNMLLQVYTKYKTELSCSSIEEKHDVWKKIAEEFSQRSSLKCSELRCMNKIKELRQEYNTLKHKPKLVPNKTVIIFLNEARNAFETSGNSAAIFSELPSSESSTTFKWKMRRRVALLRLYSIYKTELSSPDIDEQSVWQKIAEEVGKDTEWRDAEQCRYEIHNMKCEYEKNKHLAPYESGQLQAVFLDEAENAFEDIENPVVFSLQSNLERWTMSRPDCLKLLQVYAKYKAELLLKNFDVENQIVWRKVARELSEKCSYYYGKRRCCSEIHYIKKLYEKLKKKDLTNDEKPYFFDEARKAFESTECTVQLGETNSLKDNTVKQEKRD